MSTTLQGTRKEDVVGVGSLHIIIGWSWLVGLAVCEANENIPSLLTVEFKEYIKYYVWLLNVIWDLGIKSNAQTLPSYPE